MRPKAAPAGGGLRRKRAEYSHQKRFTAASAYTTTRQRKHDHIPEEQERAFKQFEGVQETTNESCIKNFEEGTDKQEGPGRNKGKQGEDEFSREAKRKACKASEAHRGVRHMHLQRAILTRFPFPGFHRFCWTVADL